MKKIIRILLVLVGLLLLIAFYQLRFSDELVHLRSSDGKVRFGYDRAQGKWLFNEYQKFMLGTDGPHIFYNADSTITVITTQAGRDSLAKVNFPAADDHVFLCQPQDTSRSPISFFRKSLTRSASTYEQPARLLAISDIEGNIGAFIDLLRANSVIDSVYRWSFGAGHLVLPGDFMDRGSDVLPCLYLIYKLEDEAEKAGGKVHFILGNHELMNMQGHASYAAPKFLELVRQLNIPYRQLYSAQTELGRWLRTKNCVEKIGDYLFLHGGISPQVAERRLSPEAMNEVLGRSLDGPNNEEAQLLTGSDGPLWYRGMATDYKEVARLSTVEFNRIADQYGVKAIVIGHTLVDSIRTEYGGRLIRLDVHHAESEPQALLIEDGQAYVTDIRGRRKRL